MTQFLTATRTRQADDVVGAAMITAAKTGLSVWLVVPPQPGIVSRARDLAAAAGVSVSARLGPHSIHLRLSASRAEGGSGKHEDIRQPPRPSAGSGRAGQTTTRSS